MDVRIVRLGSNREHSEGLRIGTVRRPPRGVLKERFSTDNCYDVWLPQLAPSAELVKQAQAATSREDWKAFTRRSRKEVDLDRLRLLFTTPILVTVTLSPAWLSDSASSVTRILFTFFSYKA